MSTYTVTLTAAQGGRHPHAFRGIEADTPQAAIVAAYRERHGDHATVTTRDVHARGNDISDTKFSVFGTAGAVTFADVERTDDTASTYTDYTAPGFYDCCGLPKNRGAHSNYCPTVPHRKELPAVEETATETLDRCAAITCKGTQCSRKARHGEHCTQHAAMFELVPGQIWESRRYGTDHTVTEHVGDDLWEITGPTGNVYVTTPQTFRALNRLTGRTQVR